MWGGFQTNFDSNMNKPKLWDTFLKVILNPIIAQKLVINNPTFFTLYLNHPQNEASTWKLFAKYFLHHWKKKRLAEQI